MSTADAHPRWRMRFRDVFWALGLEAHVGYFGRRMTIEQAIAESQLIENTQKV